MGALVDDLLVQGRELRETHISWVFLGATDVFKVKKPVSLGFLDFSTLDNRRRACEDEIRLNRRLSPDVYRGVEPVTRGRDGRHRIGGDGETVDFAVHMKRLPDDDRADVRLGSGRLTGEHIEGIATYIAEFHDRCERGPGPALYGTPAAILGNVEENFEQTGDRLLRYVNPDHAKEILSFQLGFVEERGELLERRIANERVRDGHGDLRLEHVYVDARGEVRILDCIEFNDRFRYGDVCADVAFLAMDLARSGRPDLAERFLALYARDADDYELYLLVDFYESYRAFVRGKLAALQARDEARVFFELSLAAKRKPLAPQFVLAVGGLIASGKSTLADAVGRRASVPVIDSDRVRKALAGVTPDTSLEDDAWQGAYTEAFTQQVYDELMHRAGAVLESGRGVVLDASFRSREHRKAAVRLASSRDARFVFVECRAPDDLLRQRLRDREGRGSVSDGRVGIFDAFRDRWEPPEELAPSDHIVVDTSKPIDESCAVVLDRLPVARSKTHRPR